MLCESRTRGPIDEYTWVSFGPSVWRKDQGRGCAASRKAEGNGQLNRAKRLHREARISKIERDRYERLSIKADIWISCATRSPAQRPEDACPQS